MTYKHIQKRESARVRTLNMIESMRQSSLDRVASTLVIESETLPDVASIPWGHVSHNHLPSAE